MSLLMDALKKAEQEKKEAAKRQEESDALEADSPGAETESKPPRTSLDDTDTWGQEIVDPNTTSELPTLDSTSALSNTSELELEPITQTDDTAEIPSVQSSSASSPELEDPTLNVTLNEISLAELSGEVGAVDEVEEEAESTTIGELQSDNADLLDETFHGVALDTGDVNPELFQETVQGEAFLPDDGSQTWGETLPGIPAAQLAKDIGSDDQPTPVAAQTVFAASSTTRSSGAWFRWAMGVALFLFLAAGAVLYFTNTTPLVRNMPSPQIAQGIEQVGPSLHETLKLDIQSAQAPTQAGMQGGDSATGMSGTLATELATGESIEPGAVETVVAAETTGATGAETAVTELVTEIVAEQESSVSEVVSAVSETVEEAGQAVLEATGISETSTAQSLPEQIVTEPSLIQISRSKAPADRGKTLRDAYIAYQKGAYGTAAEKYQDTLKKFPENRDALLGLAAIAYNTGDHESAYRYYARVLRLSPGDKYARAALINLQDKSSIGRSESMITTMLHDNPDEHYLHFTLGNIYAAGNRWAEAQQAFFDAYRLNSVSPDYALNLAVSLDHIGQYEAALDYYNAALELSKDTSTGFDADAVSQRIDKLEQATEVVN